MDWLNAGIAVLCPTRGRPSNVLRLVKSLADTADEPEKLCLILRIDSDDMASIASLDLFRRDATFDIQACIAPRVILSQLVNDAWNSLSGDPGKSMIVHLGADDIVYRTKGWDRLVREAFEASQHGIALVYGDDLHQGERLATHPFLSRVWVQLLGRVTPPYFVSDFGDLWLMEIGTALEVCRFLPQMVIEHLHPDAGKAEWDQTHKERLTRHREGQPQMVYQKMERERHQDYMKLRRYLDEPRPERNISIDAPSAIQQSMPMKLAMVVFSCNRPEYLAKTLESQKLLDTTGCEVDRILVDDFPLGRDDAAFTALAKEHGYELILHSTNRSLGVTWTEIWAILATRDYDYVWHQEDDVEIVEPARMTDLVEILLDHPELSQIGLMRQKWYPRESEVGPLPTDTIVSGGRLEAGGERSVYFGTLASLFPIDRVRFDYPAWYKAKYPDEPILHAASRNEGIVGKALLEESGLRSAYLKTATGQPMVKHIGEYTQGRIVLAHDPGAQIFAHRDPTRRYSSKDGSLIGAESEITCPLPELRADQPAAPGKFRIHLLSLPNCQTTRAYELDGFSQLTIRFARMMKALGNTVILYASEENTAPCDELVTVIRKYEIAERLLGTPYQSVRIDAAAPLFQKANARIIEAIAARKQPRDLICSLGGTAQQAVAAAHGDLQFVEYSIGYIGSFSPYRVFESVAWQHKTYGVQNINDVRYWDTVIPVPFDPDEFQFNETKEPFLLYVGRLANDKGLNIVAAVAEAAKIQLKVIGHGNTTLIPAGAEYLGALPAALRNEWMGRAQAVICPTTYIEPFNQIAVESQLCGTPVIATDAGGFTETIQHGITGFRCNYLGEFVTAVERCRDLYPGVIRTRAVELYSMHSLALQYQRYFERIALLWERGWYSL